MDSDADTISYHDGYSDISDGGESGEIPGEESQSAEQTEYRRKKMAWQVHQNRKLSQSNNSNAANNNGDDHHASTSVPNNKPLLKRRKTSGEEAIFDAYTSYKNCKVETDFPTQEIVKGEVAFLSSVTPKSLFVIKEHFVASNLSYGPQVVLVCKNMESEEEKLVLTQSLADKYRQRLIDSSYGLNT